MARTLDGAVKELRSLMNQLKKILPAAKSEIRMPIHKHPAQKPEFVKELRKSINVESQPQEEVIGRVPSEPVSELDKLENDLVDIEDKLNKLS